MPSGVPHRFVDRLAASWQSSCAEVRASADAVTSRAARLQQDVDRLVGIRDAWTRSRSDAASANAPAVVLGRIDGIRIAISSAKARLEARLAALLIVQHRLSQELTRCDQTVARIAQAAASCSSAWVRARAFRSGAAPCGPAPPPSSPRPAGSRPRRST